MEIIKFINKIYALKDIIRYNNVPKIHQESVAEHLAFTTMIVAELSKYYKFDLQKALLMAISHDYAEIYVNDIPYNIKRDNPELKLEYEKIENNIYKNKFEYYYKYYQEYQKQETIEALIVKFADILSVLQYTHNEVLLGNEGYMREIYEDSKKRVELMKEKLKKYEK